ncbi:hypothetical protein AMK59_8564, partial [Oryctes borbonicus]
NLVKTITSSFVEIKKDVINRNSKKNLNFNELPSSTEKENIDLASGIINNNVNESTDGVVRIKEEVMLETIHKDDHKPDITTDTLNDTFTMLSDKGDVTDGNDTTFTIEEVLLKESPPPKFTAFKIQELDDTKEFDVIQPKRLSISQRLSKSMKPLKSQKFSNLSKINKSSRVTSVASARVPKISNSKAIQLYDILGNGQVDRSLKADTNEQNKSDSILESPPSGSSTPKILKNHAMKSLLKNTLRKNNVSFADLPSISTNSNTNQNSGIPKITYRKMPNFAAIHKKTFQKMENISDYQHRKSERAKLLLSGSKPQKTSPAPLSPKNKEIKRGLLPSFNKTRDTPTKQALNHAQPLKKETVRIVKKSPSTTTINQIPTNKIPVKARPIKVNNFVTTSQVDLNISASESTSSKGKVALTRFGFKVPLTNKKEEIVKTIMTKARALPNNHTKNEQRAVIKGVRSNRRFDLLMKMRLNK